MTTWVAMSEEAMMTAVTLAILGGLALLTIVVRTFVVVARDGGRRVGYRAAYDTRRPEL
ncbi:hypothetical protein [Gordonia aurantiaca]|uniref:hypothetical protein n=1 Tax=Gordonia sp. B21 TaxID=3151852 RepID=UPI003267171C